MFSFLNQKKLFALNLVLTIVTIIFSIALAAELVPPTPTSEIRHLKVETVTAALRCATLAVNQWSCNKFGVNSKKALMSDIATDMARLINDGISGFNEMQAFMTISDTEENEESKTAIFSDIVTVIPMYIDFLDIFIKIKKLYNRDYSLRKVEYTQVSKLLSILHKFTPVIEIVAVSARSCAKFSNNDYFIQSCTAALTLTRAIEFCAQYGLNKSSKVRIIVLAIAALVIIAEVVDCVSINWVLNKKNKDVNIDESTCENKKIKVQHELPAKGVQQADVIHEEMHEEIHGEVQQIIGNTQQEVAVPPAEWTQGPPVVESLPSAQIPEGTVQQTIMQTEDATTLAEPELTEIIANQHVPVELSEQMVMSMDGGASTQASIVSLTDAAQLEMPQPQSLVSKTQVDKGFWSLILDDESETDASKDGASHGDSWSANLFF